MSIPVTFACVARNVRGLPEDWHRESPPWSHGDAICKSEVNRISLPGKQQNCKESLMIYIIISYYINLIIII